MRDSIIIVCFAVYFSIGAAIQYLAFDYSVGPGWRALVTIAWPLLVLNK